MGSCHAFGSSGKGEAVKLKAQGLHSIKMGMHRDGARWNLPQDVVEERRKVFWELNAADTFQAHCFSRPYESFIVSVTALTLCRCAINPEHCDTAFPSQPLSLNGGKSYSILRFELSQLSSEYVLSF